MTPFIAYVAAEAIHASGVLAVVIAGLLLGHKAPVIQTAAVADRRADSTGGPSRSSSRTRLPAHRPADAVDPRRGRRQRRRRRPIVAVCLRGARRRHRAADGVGVPRALPADRGRGRRPGQRAAVEYTVVLGWAGMRGVVTLAAAFAIPQRHAAPRGAAAGRARGHRGDAAPARADAAVGGPPAPGARRPTRGRTPSPGAELLQQATQAGWPVRPSSRRGATTPSVRDLLRQRLEQRDFAAWERLGPDAAGRGDAERAVRPAPPGACWRRAGARARAARPRADPARGRRGRAGRARRRGVDDRHRLEQRGGARRWRDGDAAVRRAGDECAHLDAAPVPRRAVSRPPVRGLPPRGHPVGAPAAVPGRAATSAAATPRRAGTPPRTSPRGHPVIASAEPGENWRWCFVDELVG